MFNHQRFAVEGMHCAACMRRIETSMASLEGVKNPRVNLSSNQLSLDYNPQDWNEESLAAEVTKLGYPTRPLANDSEGQLNSKAYAKQLLIAMVVAGLGMVAVMLPADVLWLSPTSLDGVSRRLLGWYAALVGTPAIGYAGMIFFRSSFAALRSRHVNMDVPIAFAIFLIIGLSYYELWRGGDIYFEEALMLLFFLLMGRALEARLKARIWDQAAYLIAMLNKPARQILSDGGEIIIQGQSLKPKDRVRLIDGDHVVADGVIESGAGELDSSSLTGESLPLVAKPAMKIKAGMVLVRGEIIMQVEKAASETELAEMQRQVEIAGQQKSRYVGLADRAAQIYAPLVHGLAALSIPLSLWWRGVGLEEAILTAAAVLIITCPCALGLAVPATQVAAISRLFSRRMLVKSGDALEKLAEIGYVLVDKTGTLANAIVSPLEAPDQTQSDNEAESKCLLEATALARYGRHPLVAALVSRYGNLAPQISFSAIADEPGQGLRGLDEQGREWRLGSAPFCGERDTQAVSHQGPILWFKHPSHSQALPIRFHQKPHEGAKVFLNGLREAKIPVEMLSGDQPQAVAQFAAEMGIDVYQARLTPLEKLARLDDLRQQLAKSNAPKGKPAKIMAVGDGANDAAMLAAADVAIVLAHGAPLSQSLADVVLPHHQLGLIPDLLAVARKAKFICLENFGLAALYNVVAIPLAFLGYVSPLVASLAMSASSIVVVSNALRLNFFGFSGERKAA